MGIFKDVRKLNKQAKEMAKEQGVDTSLRGLMKQAPGMLEQASQQLQQVQTGQAESQRLKTEGLPATAKLLAVRDAGVTLGGAAVGGLDNPVADLDLEVTVEGREPYRVTVRQMVPRLAVARLLPGSELPVRVDAADPSAVLVDWDAPVA
jgi:hypothetical protein